MIAGCFGVCVSCPGAGCVKVDRPGDGRVFAKLAIGLMRREHPDFVNSQKYDIREKF